MVSALKKILSLIYRHKIIILMTISIVALIYGALWYRGRLLAQLNTTPKESGSDVYYSRHSGEILPTLPPTPTLEAVSKNNGSVLGTSDNSTFYTPYLSPTPYPTLTPFPTFAPVQSVSGSSNTQSSGGSSNPHCTTGTGVVNSWYSDVYPNPPITTNTGSVQLIVTLRDCFQNTASANDNLTISVISGDPNTQVNGHNLPYTLSAQNGSANFYVTSQVSGTVTLDVKDTTSSFDVTDINNHNPTITFSNNNSGNPNCTTGPGVANFWYSEVDPVSPVSAQSGSSVTFYVNIKDCNKNNVSSTENLTITQTSNDSGFTINGQASPVKISARGGQVSFTINSPNAGTDTFAVHDDTNSFTLTDANNKSQSVIFSAAPPTPTPTPQSPTATPPVPTPTTTVAPTPTQTVTPTSSPTPTP